jgi:hypothetical protein
VLVDERGNIKAELKRGEHKSLQTDRVILMPGPDEEVAWVNKMYRWLIEEDLTFREIAERLNEDGVATDLDRPWTSGTVCTVLTNEKYIGNNVYNRSSFKLKKLHVDNPPDMWVRKEGAFEGIVPLEFFLTAQEIITARSARLSDEELLEHLKRLYSDAGQLSGVLIDQTPDMPSSSAYRTRFGSLARAYEMIGYRSDRDQERIALNKRLRGMHPEIIARTEAAIAAVGGTVARDPKTDLLTINDEMVVSLVLARCQPQADAVLQAATLRLDDLHGIDKLTRCWDHCHRADAAFSHILIRDWTIDLESQLRDAVPEILKVQVLKDNIGQSPICWRARCAHFCLDQRVARLFFIAKVHADIVARNIQQLAVGPDAPDPGDRSLAQPDSEAGRVEILDRCAARTRAKEAKAPWPADGGCDIPLFIICCPDDVASDPHAPEQARNSDALRAACDAHGIQTRALKSLVLVSSNQARIDHAAKARADEATDCGR